MLTHFLFRVERGRSMKKGAFGTTLFVYVAPRIRSELSGCKSCISIGGYIRSSRIQGDRNKSAEVPRAASKSRRESLAEKTHLLQQCSGTSSKLSTRNYQEDRLGTVSAFFVTPSQRVETLHFSCSSSSTSLFMPVAECFTMAMRRFEDANTRRCMRIAQCGYAPVTAQSAPSRLDGEQS